MDQKREYEPTQPDELMALAFAIASREQKELARARLITAIDIEPTDTIVEHEALTNGAIRNLLRIQNLEGKDYLLKMLGTELEPKYQLVADDIFRRTGNRISIEEAKEIVLNHAMDMMNASGQTEEQSAEDFKDLLDGARIVAEAHGIKIADVYESDELFLEAHRVAYVLEELAMRYVAMLSGHTVQSMTQLMLASIQKATIPPGVDEAVYFKEVSMGKEFRDTVVQVVLEKRRVVQSAANDHLTRIWGQEAVLALPDDIKRKLSI